LDVKDWSTHQCAAFLLAGLFAVSMLHQTLMKLRFIST
jgi:hypothetical protein